MCDSYRFKFETEANALRDKFADEIQLPATYRTIEQNKISVLFAIIMQLCQCVTISNAKKFKQRNMNRLNNQRLFVYVLL